MLICADMPWIVHTIFNTRRRSSVQIWWEGRSVLSVNCMRWRQCHASGFRPGSYSPCQLFGVMGEYDWIDKFESLRSEFIPGMDVDMLFGRSTIWQWSRVNCEDDIDSTEGSSFTGCRCVRSRLSSSNGSFARNSFQSSIHDEMPVWVCSYISAPSRRTCAKRSVNFPFLFTFFRDEHECLILRWSNLYFKVYTVNFSVVSKTYHRVA